MNEPKRHHTTSAFYLRRFALDEKVIVVDRNDFTRSRTASVKDALVEQHFYSLPAEEGWDTTIEKELATKIEGPARKLSTRVRQIQA